MSTSTPAQQALLERLRTVLAADERIESAWLSGSFGAGTGDAYSDIDVLAVVDEEDLPHCLAEYAGPRNPVGETVLMMSLYGRIVSAVTPDWERYDIALVTPKEFRAYDKAKLKPLTVASLDAPAPPPRPPKPYQPSADALVTAATEFLRVLGLASVGIPRGEWLSVQEGVFLLRKALIELMIEANGIGRNDRGGAKKLNPWLSEEHRAAVEAIPQPSADRDQLLAANAALAALYLPLARRLVAEAGGTWPQPLEDATRRKLETSLGLKI